MCNTWISKTTLMIKAGPDIKYQYKLVEKFNNVSSAFYSLDWANISAK